MKTLSGPKSTNEKSASKRQTRQTEEGKAPKKAKITTDEIQQGLGTQESRCATTMNMGKGRRITRLGFGNWNGVGLMHNSFIPPQQNPTTQAASSTRQLKISYGEIEGEEKQE
ncbi:hypothetical protein ACP275_09G048600 [Erythranthe tilingii]